MEFVVHNALVPLKTLQGQEQNYNKRVVECRFAIAAMSKQAGVITDFAKCEFKNLDELQIAKQLSFDQLLDLAKDTFKKQAGYTLKEIEEEFKVKDPMSIIKDLPQAVQVKEQNEIYNLYGRALHILNESKKMNQFCEILQDESMKDSEKIERIGTLMNESHFNNRS